MSPSSLSAVSRLEPHVPDLRSLWGNGEVRLPSHSDRTVRAAVLSLLLGDFGESVSFQKTSVGVHLYALRPLHYRGFRSMCVGGVDSNACFSLCCRSAQFRGALKIEQPIPRPPLCRQLAQSCYPSFPRSLVPD